MKINLHLKDINEGQKELEVHAVVKEELGKEL